MIPRNAPERRHARHRERPGACPRATVLSAHRVVQRQSLHLYTATATTLRLTITMAPCPTIIALFDHRDDAGISLRRASDAAPEGRHGERLHRYCPPRWPTVRERSLCGAWRPRAAGRARIPQYYHSVAACIPSPFQGSAPLIAKSPGRKLMTSMSMAWRTSDCYPIWWRI